MVPDLLVSVRSADEARAAIQGGAQIVDVKDPEVGPLGLADAAVLDQIAGQLLSTSPGPRFSVAMGELTEWQHAGPRQISAMDWLPTSPLPLFLKAGSSGLSADDATESLHLHWRNFMARLEECCVPPESRDNALQFAAVAYADHERCSAPNPLAVTKMASQLSMSVVLLDTYVKDDTRLNDWLTMTQLHEIRAECHLSGLRLALAGRINSAMLPELAAVQPDIIGVRGAVCRNADRRDCMTADRVQCFRKALEAAFETVAT